MNSRNFVPQKFKKINNSNMKILKIATLAITVVLASCGNNTSVNDAGQSFKLMEISPKEITLDRSYSAAIRGRQDIRIIPRVDGYLTEIRIKEGEKVRKGQTLFVIDQVSYKAALQAAKANVAVCAANVSNARLTYDSKKALYDKNIVSDFDRTSAENELKTAEARLMQAKAEEDAAQNNLSFTVIKSSSDGVVGKIPYRIGDYVNSGIQDGLTVVADNSQMYVYFSMAEGQVMELTETYQDIETAIARMPDVKLKLSNGSVYGHDGRIESISGVIDATTGAASVRAVFPNEQGRLLSGGAGSVIMPYNRAEAFVVPQEATFEIQNKVYVYKVEEGKAVSAIVEVDKVNNGKEYIVTDGLNAGDIIIAEGAGLVQEGTKVRMEENKE